jgi:hypothetical protein
MVASIYYPYPNGQSIGIKSFVMLWFRELFILGAILIAIILAGGVGCGVTLRNLKVERNES